VARMRDVAEARGAAPDPEPPADTHTDPVFRAWTRHSDSFPVAACPLQRSRMQCTAKGSTCERRGCATKPSNDDLISYTTGGYTTTAHPARRQAVLLVAQMCSIFGAWPQWLQGRARAGERAPGVLGEETLMTR